MSVIAVALFCEDIREEKSGQDTLVGTLPDNVNIRRIPGAMPKLAVYIRILVPVNDAPKRMSVVATMPDGDTVQLGTLDELIEPAISESRKRDMPFGGIAARAVVANLVFKKAGKFIVELDVDGKKQICGMLNIVTHDANQPSTGSEQPASQSPTAS
jgi:hypothetical protein